MKNYKDDIYCALLKKCNRPYLNYVYFFLDPVSSRRHSGSLFDLSIYMRLKIKSRLFDRILRKYRTRIIFSRNTIELPVHDIGLDY